MTKKIFISCSIIFPLLLLWGHGGLAESRPPTLPPLIMEYKYMPQYDVDLPIELQAYTYYQCELYGLSYEMVLAIMKTESDFRVELVSKTNDHGLMQINELNHAWFSDVLQIKDFDALNPYHNISASCWFLSHIRTYWLEQEVSDEQLFTLMLLSYNRGISGAKRYIHDYGWENSYVDKVMKAKEFIERQGE